MAGQRAQCDPGGSELPAGSRGVVGSQPRGTVACTVRDHGAKPHPVPSHQRLASPPQVVILNREGC